MIICTSHKHSSVASARKCYETRLRLRADRKLRHVVGPGKQNTRVQMRKNVPPRFTKHGEVYMSVFYEDANMPY